MSTGPGPGEHEHGPSAGPGTTDLVSLLYVVGGIPGMCLFFVLFFILVRACGLPG